MHNIEKLRNCISDIENKTFVNVVCYDLNLENWQKIIDFLNQDCKLSFLEYQTERNENQINFQSVLDFWTGKNENGYLVNVHFKSFDFRCYFNVMDYLECDMLFKDIIKENNLEELVYFLCKISKLISKEIILEEDITEFRFAKIKGDEIIINEENKLK